MVRGEQFIPARANTSWKCSPSVVIWPPRQPSSLILKSRTVQKAEFQLVGTPHCLFCRSGHLQLADSFITEKGAANRSAVWSAIWNAPSPRTARPHIQLSIFYVTKSCQSLYRPLPRRCISRSRPRQDKMQQLPGFWPEHIKNEYLVGSLSCGLPDPCPLWI